MICIFLILYIEIILSRVHSLFDLFSFFTLAIFIQFAHKVATERTIPFRSRQSFTRGSKVMS